MNHVPVGAAGHSAEVLVAVDDVIAVRGRRYLGLADPRATATFRLAAPASEQLPPLNNVREPLRFLLGRGQRIDV